MRRMNLVKISKFLSLVLRHKPARFGLSLDEHGWTIVDELLAATNRAGVSLTRELLRQVVRHNDKERFAFSDDGLRVRATYGHSVAVDLGLEPVTPPEILFHGTATRFVASIRMEGLSFKISTDGATRWTNRENEISKKDLK